VQISIREHLNFMEEISLMGMFGRLGLISARISSPTASCDRALEFSTATMPQGFQRRRIAINLPWFQQASLKITRRSGRSI
jgi:hypothetical protein